MFPVKRSREHFRAKARVSPSFAEKVMRALAETGHRLDPELVKSYWKKAGGIGSCLTTEMEIFLWLFVETTGRSILFATSGSQNSFWNG
jgi:hypothetical protein